GIEWVAAAAARRAPEVFRGNRTTNTNPWELALYAPLLVSGVLMLLMPASEDATSLAGRVTCAKGETLQMRWVQRGTKKGGSLYCISPSGNGRQLAAQWLVPYAVFFDLAYVPLATLLTLLALRSHVPGPVVRAPSKGGAYRGRPDT